MFCAQHGWEWCNGRLTHGRLPLLPNPAPLTPEKEEEMSAAVRLLVGIALVVVAEVDLQILKRRRLFDCCANSC